MLQPYSHPTSSLCCTVSHLLVAGARPSVLGTLALAPTLAPVLAAACPLAGHWLQDLPPGQDGHRIPPEYLPPCLEIQLNTCNGFCLMNIHHVLGPIALLVRPVDFQPRGYEFDHRPAFKKYV